MKKVEQIYTNLKRVFEIAKRDNIPTYVAADRMAEERIQKVRDSRTTFLRNEKSILSHRTNR
jgi:leucine dehydrogenase